jgi:fibronectin-binding autotransporter adhesin
MLGNLTWAPDGVGSIGASGTSRPEDIHGKDDVFVEDALSVSGASSFAAIGATNATLSGTLGVSGASTLAGLSATTGSFSSTLGVTGATTLAGLSAITGSFSSTLGVTGAATFGSTLGGTGASTLAAVSATTGTFSSTLGVTGLATLTGGATSASDIRISAAAPNFRLTETDQALDTKQWLVRSSSSVLELLAVNDAESSGTQAITITRSTTTPQLTTISTAIAFQNTITASTLSGGENHNYAPTGIGTAVMVRVAGNAISPSKITGITSGVAGRELDFCNTDTDLWSFKPEDSDSTSTNRIAGELSSEYVVNPETCATVKYDGISNRWRIKAGAQPMSPL